MPIDGPAKRLDLGKLIASASCGLDASVSRDGHIAIVASETQQPNELFYMASLTAKPERLTHFNASITALETGRTESINSSTGESVRSDGMVVQCARPPV